MKKIVALFLLSCFAFILTGCGAYYGVKRDKQGIYRTTELEGNLLAKDAGDGDVQFNLIKYAYGSKTFYGAKIIYKYNEGGVRLGIAFLSVPVGGQMIFGLKKKDGIKVNLNGTSGFFLKYRISPKHEKKESRDPQTGNVTVTYVETAECLLSKQQLYALLKAKSLSVMLYSASQDHQKPQVRYFKDDNFKNMRKFYTEEILMKRKSQ